MYVTLVRLSGSSPTITNHSLLVYPVKGGQVVREGMCLQGGIAVGAVETASLPLLARLESESHAMVGGSR